ncbi:MAG TPA: ATP synthase F1 subunit delta [Acidimicrobiales bacterium]|nr:ATP synthase F1 subunit delta [Acidimicrobiales bacterium]
MAERAEAYAEALIGIADSEGHVERIENELFRIARSFEGSEELRTALTDPAIPVERRIGIVEDLLAGKALPLTMAIVSFIVAAGRARDLPAIADAYVALAAERRAEAVAEVRSAIPLDEEQQRRLAEALGKATGKRISVKVIIDPSVLGGLVARVGDTVIDGSVRHRLDQLKESV